MKAKLRYLSIAPKKVRRIANLLKGMSVIRAESELRARPQRASEPIRKLLHSAIANAEHNLHLEKSKLYISKITVDAGPSLKRMLPRAFGRATPLWKRSSHVTMVLSTREISGKEAEEAIQAPQAVIFEEKKREPEIAAKAEKQEKPKVKRAVREFKKEIKPSARGGFARRFFRRKAI